ncbi:hypothetical protein PL8927_790181 [Planktothrix serta PCC 8927]|uniref:AbrB/MazE/SpoVT family DNA-binding domain-containing protein n=1 Tax=Planktothrix serta PCC 8927 TaxID=671068 RepID=A0A7Z9C1Y1_9CYAN|nr:antitoxin family protein [Planktothrix serta]VXD24089.1 hypothetical protein PL8927_790181 [Planktothrix serta PCC 8927]
MPQIFRATYRNGTFILNNPCDLTEGTEVELLIQSSYITTVPRRIGWDEKLAIMAQKKDDQLLDDVSTTNWEIEEWQW